MLSKKLLSFPGNARTGVKVRHDFIMKNAGFCRQDHQHIYITGGHDSTAHAVYHSGTNAKSIQEYTPLNNSHEEADTHIIVHAKLVASM